MKRDFLLELIEKEFGIGCRKTCEERVRQIEEKGFTPEKDVISYHGENLAMAAASYATPEFQRVRIGGRDTPYCFPFAEKWWKPTPSDRVRELEKAGALIAAEIDRLKSVEEKRSNHLKQHNRNL